MLDFKTEVLTFLYNLLEELNNKSNSTYEIFANLLQERSHSFGIEILSETRYKLIIGLDNIYNSKDLEYLFYDNSIFQDPTLDLFLDIFKSRDLDIELITKLLVEQYSILYLNEMNIGKDLSLLISDLFDSPSKYNFKPIADINDMIITNLDRLIYKEYNFINENYDDVDGFWYWFLVENECGVKSLGLSLDDIRYNIKDIEDFLQFLKIYKTKLKDNK